MRGGLGYFWWYGGGGGSTYTASLSGSFPSPSGVSTINNIFYRQGLAGSLPAPSGAIVKQTGKFLTGDFSSGSGTSTKSTTRTLSGAVPAPSGTLQESATLRQTVSGIMGAILGAIATVLNPIIVPTRNKMKIIGSAFRKLIGG